MTVDFIWTSDIESILENIRCNCVTMSGKHKRRYIYLKGVLRYFRIPIIILSGLNSVMSVGLQPYLEQGIISAGTSLISLTCGIIGSIELFLSIQTQMENELLKSKEYYLLSIDIYKVLCLERANRHIDGIPFLDEKFATYEKLIENSNVINQKITDSLAPLPVRGTKGLGLPVIPGVQGQEERQLQTNSQNNVVLSLSSSINDKDDKDSSSDTTGDDSGDFNLPTPTSISKSYSSASSKNRNSLFKNLKNTIKTSIHKKKDISDKDSSEDPEPSDILSSTNDSALNDSALNDNDMV